MRAAKTATKVRREQIADAALALLNARHGAEPSIAGIAKRVGVVPSAVYRHYRGKDAILYAALERIRQRLQENLALARQDTADPLSRIRGLFMRHAGLLAANPGLPSVLLSRGIFGTSKARRQKVAGVMTGYLQGVAEVVAEGQCSGHIRRDLEPRSGALVFVGMLLPAVVLREISDDALDVTEHARRVWPALASALAPAAVPAGGPELTAAGPRSGPLTTAGRCTKGRPQAAGKRVRRTPAARPQGRRGQAPKAGNKG